MVFSLVLVDGGESRPVNDSVHCTCAPLSKMSWVIKMLAELKPL